MGVDCDDETGVKQSVEGLNDPAMMCAWYGNGSSVK